MFKSMIIKLGRFVSCVLRERLEISDGGLRQRRRCLHNAMCEMTPTLGWNTFERLIWIIGAVKTAKLPRLSVWHRGDWFSERGPRRGEPFTHWQPNKRLAEALCPLTSSLKADCVATQLYSADSQTAGLVIINPSAQRWSSAGQARLHESTFFSLCVCSFSFICTEFSLLRAHFIFRFLLCEEGWMCEIQFTLNTKLC